MAPGPYRFHDEDGTEWVAIIYRAAAHLFSHADKPGRAMVAFLEGEEEGVPAYEVPAPAVIPNPPSEGWWRSLLEGARALRRMDEPLTA